MSFQRVAKGIVWTFGSILAILLVGWVIVSNLSNMDAVVQWARGESPTQALIRALDPLELAALALAAGLVLGMLGTHVVSRSVHTHAEADRQRVIKDRALQEKEKEHSQAMSSARDSCQHQIDLLNEEKTGLQKQTAEAAAEIHRLQAKLDEKPAPPRPVMHFDSKDPQCLERDHASQTVAIKVTNEGGQMARVSGLSLERVVVDGGERRYDKSAFFPLRAPNGAFECEIPPSASRYFRVFYQAGHHASNGATTEFAPKTLREPKFHGKTLDLTLRLQADFGDPLKEFHFVAIPSGPQWGFFDYVDDTIVEPAKA